MISCIICSNNSTYLSSVKESIAQTIGVAYELIIYDNTGQSGICKAYNDGATKSKYSYLCLIHEDILFLTPGWGSRAIAHYKKAANPGVLGIAGSVYKSRMVSSWWQPPVNGIEPKRVNIIQHYKHTSAPKEHYYINPHKEERSLVAALDGVFLFTAKETWSNHPFDEVLLKGFHAYDLDFTLSVGTKQNNYVVYDILVEHFSEGVNDMAWLMANILVHLKWKRQLPVIRVPAIKKKDLRLVDQLWFHQLLSIKPTRLQERLHIMYACLPLLSFNTFRRSVLLSIYKYVFFP